MDVLGDGTDFEGVDVLGDGADFEGAPKVPAAGPDDLGAAEGFTSRALVGVDLAPEGAVAGLLAGGLKPEEGADGLVEVADGPLGPAAEGAPALGPAGVLVGVLTAGVTPFSAPLGV